MEEQIRKGKNTIITVICILVAMDVIGIITNLAYSKSSVSSIIGLAIMLVLAYFMYKKQNWARIVILVLLGLAAFVYLIGIMAAFVIPLLGVVSLLMFVVYLVMFIVLLANKNVKAYMQQPK